MPQLILSQVCDQRGFSFVGTVGPIGVCTTCQGKFQLTDELGFVWETDEDRVDDSICRLVEKGMLRYVSHIFAPQVLH